MFFYLNLFMKRHMYHLVDRSPWPLTLSLGLLFATTGLVCYMNRISNGFLIFLLGLIITILTMYVWWRDVIRESTYEGNHTIIVQKGLKIGFILFVGSEVVFFGGFFWAFFHSSLSPSIVLGMIWPPINIVVLNPWAIPLLNTSILLLSGLSITWVHFAIIAGNYNNAVNGFIITLVLAVAFTGLQIGEYFYAPFNFTDSVYGSAFFALTGLHGLHVIVGTIFITICFIRLLKLHFTNKHHLGFDLHLDIDIL